jgi:hypothetical protein
VEYKVSSIQYRLLASGFPVFGELIEQSSAIYSQYFKKFPNFGRESLHIAHQFTAVGVAERAGAISFAAIAFASFAFELSPSKLTPSEQSPSELPSSELPSSELPSSEMPLSELLFSELPSLALSPRLSVG